jgi:hypothetical protein
MKASDFKKIIKEAVREVFQEEMREILLEAVKSPRVPVGAGGYGSVTETRTATGTGTVSEASRQAFRDMMGGNFSPNKQDTFSFNTNNTQPAYTPPPISTTGEGSSLPAGEVNLDQIMGLMNK